MSGEWVTGKWGETKFYFSPGLLVSQFPCQFFYELHHIINLCKLHSPVTTKLDFPPYTAIGTSGDKFLFASIIRDGCRSREFYLCASPKFDPN